MRRIKKKIKTTLATKFAFTFVSLKLFTMFIVAFAVHRAVLLQFKDDYQRRVNSSLTAIKKEIARKHDLIEDQLGQLAVQLTEDNDYRLNVTVLNNYHQPYVIDYAQNYMRAMGLDALQIIDEKGVVISSGHFRNAFGARVAPVVRKFANLDSSVPLIRFKRVNGDFTCLAAMDRVTIGNQKFFLLGGIEITPDFLKEMITDSSSFVIIKMEDQTIQSPTALSDSLNLISLAQSHQSKKLPRWLEDDYSVGSFTLPTISGANLQQARWYYFYPKKELAALIYNLNRNIIAITVVGVIIAIVLSFWRTKAIAQPLNNLAEKASRLSLRKLNVQFDSKTDDEVGVLSNALQRMVARLRQSRRELEEAEKFAARAEIASQVNHDIKNGFIPIRNVMEHWLEIAKTEPENLVKIFKERQSTVMDSLTYLENLAKSYSRLKTEKRDTELNLNQLIGGLVDNYQEFTDQNIRFEFHQDPSQPVVYGDAIQLRRALENVIRNSIDAIEQSGWVQLTVESQDTDVVVRIEDNGCGIEESVRKQLFTNKLVSAKPEGSGIGLANVKRIVQDMGGKISLQSEAGNGTTVQITIPRAARVVS